MGPAPGVFCVPSKSPCLPSALGESVFRTMLLVTLEEEMEAQGKELLCLRPALGTPDS